MPAVKRIHARDFREKKEILANMLSSFGTNGRNEGAAVNKKRKEKYIVPKVRSWQNFNSGRTFID